MTETFKGKVSRPSYDEQNCNSIKTLRISGVMVLGPFDENAAMNGAGFVPNFVVARFM